MQTPKHQKEKNQRQ
jgi:hypothetical protein